MSIKYYLKVSEEKLFFTSDTHFFHKNIIKFCQRPYKNIEEMQEQFILNWNKVVPQDGIVFFLGDFAFGNSTEWIKIINQLNGYIYFILGNHDLQNCNNLKHLENKNSTCLSHMAYIKIIETSQVIVLSHYPLLTYPKHLWNLCGHTHSSKINKFNFFKTQYDVGVDNNNYTPVSFKEIKEKIQNQIKKNGRYNKFNRKEIWKRFRNFCFRLFKLSYRSKRY